MTRSGSNVADLVSEALLFNDNIGRAIIEVRDKDGIITLRGTIESERDRLAAEDLALKQKGVVKVINRLRIPGF